ncbi:MAG: hypothetical protein MPJ50_00195 [Pirellulales bacterium]|nr:hypothetical protein [Pirellulales bacterium]
MKQRMPQLVLIVSTLGVFWLGMQIVHEAGHLLAAWFVGADVKHVILHPLKISQTQLEQRPPPVSVVWCGSLFGMAAPLVCYATWEFLRLPGGYLWRCFAGFCLLANGTYLAAGALANVGDAHDLLLAGIPTWRVVGVGLLSAPPGLWMFRRQIQHFGLGQAAGRVSVDAAYVMAFLLLAIVSLELAKGGRIDFAG